MHGNQFIPNVYKGTVYVMQTKPVGAYPNQHLQLQDIEEAWVFDGVWPNSVPFDALSSDITTNDSIQLSVTFSYDGYLVLSKVVELVENPTLS